MFKNIVLLSALVVFPSLGSAQVKPQLLREVTNAVDSLMSDTVNEGEMQAFVNEKELSCTTAKYRDPSKGLVKCDVTFDVESNYSEPQTCQLSCFLIHVYDLKTLKITSRVESLMASCMETLSSGCD